LHDLPKLGVPRLCDRLHSSVDPDGTVYLDNVDVNGILPREDGPSIWMLACLLNSKLIDYVFRLISVPFRGSFYSANKQFIGPLPICIADADTEGSLEAVGHSLHDSTRELLDERHEFGSWLSDLIGVPVSSLAGRTKLERPDALTVAEIIDLLLTNRKQLSLDPGSRSFRDRLTEEHGSSVEKIAELIGTIRQRETAVDDAVFDLYEVTSSQRALVEAAYTDQMTT
jgi:hypothetical protein